jgi:hypothetical protein
MDHIEADRIRAAEKYLLGDMSAPERDDFEEHLFLCHECAETVRTGAVFADNARAVFREQALQPQVEPAAARAKPAKPWWKRYGFPVLAPTFASLVLLCVAAYQQFVLLPGLRLQLAQATSPQPLSAFPLRPVARGEQQVIVVPKSGRFLSLYFDVVTESPSGYICEVRNTAGSVSFTVQVPQPKRGEPVNLLLERSQLPAGEYVLSVGTPPPEAKEVGQYTFRVNYK